MVPGQEEGPPFIRGLLFARKTLIDLKQNKLKEAERINSDTATKVDNYLEVAKPTVEPQPTAKSV